jgi:hypothetical protein
MRNDLILNQLKSEKVFKRSLQLARGFLDGVKRLGRATTVFSNCMNIIKGALMLNLGYL